MKKTIYNKLICSLGGILLIILFWIILSSKISIFPPILQVFYKFCTNLVNNLVILSIFNTILRCFIAFTCTLLIGIITSNLAYKYKTFKYFLHPIISLLRSIPTISVILIVIIIVKLELITHIIIFIITFPIVYQTVLNSLENIDKELIVINKLDNTNSFKNFFLFTLPMSYNGIGSAIIQTFGLSFKIQIMSELLIGSTKLKGIGILMQYYKNNLELDNLFAITLIIILIVYLFELLIKTLIKRYINLT